MNENFDSAQHPRSANGRFATKAVDETPDGTAALNSVSDHPSDMRPVYDPDDYTMPNARIQPIGPEIDQLEGRPAIGPVERTVHANGTVEYRDAAARLHRLDGPALSYPNGDQSWYRNGVLHREDGPAEIDEVNGERRWFREGRLLGVVRDDDPRFADYMTPRDAEGFIGPKMP